MYDKLLLNIKNYFKQDTRTNAEIKAKLFEIFEDNVADYERFANWYDTSKPTTNIVDKSKYEHYVIEDYKKRMYGEDYEIKKFVWCGNEL